MSQKSTETVKSLTLKERWERWTPPETLPECVRLFFEILDSKEYSEHSGQMFHPTKFNAEEKVIDSIRVWDCHRLGKLLPKMKELANDYPTGTRTEEPPSVD